MLNSPFIARVMQTGAHVTITSATHDGPVTVSLRNDLITLKTVTGPQADTLSLLEQVLTEGLSQLPTPPDPKEPWPVDRDFAPPIWQGWTPAQQLEHLAKVNGGVRVIFDRLTPGQYYPAFFRIERQEQPGDHDPYNRLLGKVAVAKPKRTTAASWQKDVTIEDPGAAFWACVAQALGALWSFSPDPYNHGQMKAKAKTGTF